MSLELIDCFERYSLVFSPIFVKQTEIALGVYILFPFKFNTNFWGFLSKVWPRWRSIFHVRTFTQGTWPLVGTYKVSQYHTQTDIYCRAVGRPEDLGGVVIQALLLFLPKSRGLAHWKPGIKFLFKKSGLMTIESITMPVLLSL